MTDSEYSAVLHRQAITETRRLRAMTGAALDAEFIRGSDDATAIARVLHEAFMRNDPDVVRRLVPLGQSRLRLLARLESRRAGTPGHAPLTRPVEAEIERKYAEWLAAEASRSAVARRARLIANQDRAVRAIDRHLATTVEHLGLAPKGAHKRQP